MNMCRRFSGEPIAWLIVAMLAGTVAANDQLLTERPRRSSPARLSTS